MRIEGQTIPQSLVESSKSLEKKGLTMNNSLEDSASEETRPFQLSPFGTVGTYSVNSLKAAVEYHVKFLAVAENNMVAAGHPPTIPGEILDHFKGLHQNGLTTGD
ncbi:MAG: hypothetical protein JW793_15660 [Acidobacteria bacterium]|nr:hypothetical protein [Acidobacteriota bacterium]